MTPQTPGPAAAADWTPGVCCVLSDLHGIMYAMSSHLAILAIGLAIGSGATYLVLTLSDLKIRPQRGKAGGLLHLECPPLNVVPLADLPDQMQIRLAPPPQEFPLAEVPTPDFPARNQFTLFEESLTPCWAARDSPGELFLRSADTQPDSE